MTDAPATMTARADRPGHAEALRRSGLTHILAAFDPHVAGTPPLGLDLPGSDIDILCHAPDPGHFAAVLFAAFAGEAGFLLRQWTGAGRPVIASFGAHGWPFEIFGAAAPVVDQPGWRHFEVERRLLALGGESLRAAVMRHRRAGLKTEPAFAAALDLVGDPYARLLDLEHQSDAALADLLIGAGYPAAR